MSTDVIKAEELAVQQFRDKLAMFQEAAAANVGGPQGLTPFDLRRIKVPSGESRFWQIQALGKIQATEQIDGIVVLWRDTRAYWPKSSDDPSSDSKTPPVCSSIDGIFGSGKPGGQCIATREAPDTVCPFAQFHSDQKGGAGQACKAMRQLFLMRTGEEGLLPDLICLPPTSVKPCKDYFNALTGASQPTFAVITRLGLEKRQNPAKKEYSVVAFEKLRDCTRLELYKARRIRNLLAGMAGAVVLDYDAPKEQED